MGEPGTRPEEQGEPTTALSELVSALERARLSSLASADQLEAAAIEDAALSERLKRAAALPRSQRERLLQRATERVERSQAGPAAQAHLARLVDEVREALARAHAHGVLTGLSARSGGLAELEAVLREAAAEPDSTASEEPAPPLPQVREQPKVGRNDPCPCGSGKKHKRCCQSARA